MHLESTTIPTKITVITQKSSGQTLNLPFNTSVFIYQDMKNIPQTRDIKNGLQVMKLPEAITRLTKNYFSEHPIEAELALSLVRDPSQLLHYSCFS